MSEPLPAGWVGNAAFHHTTRGAFRLEVWRWDDGRSTWKMGIGWSAVAGADRAGHPDAATARAAVLARLAEIVGEVDEVPVALGVAALPGADDEHELDVVVLVDGRPMAATACAFGDRIRARSGTSCYRVNTPVYPESAAPALWRAYLRGRS
jgi:hypothetical protein